MFVPSLRWTLNGCPICQHSLVDVKDPMVSFVKSRWAIVGTMNNLQIPTLPAVAQPPPQSKVLPHSLVLHTNGESCARIWLVESERVWCRNHSFIAYNKPVRCTLDTMPMLKCLATFTMTTIGVGTGARRSTLKWVWEDQGLNYKEPVWPIRSQCGHRPIRNQFG